MVVVEKDLTAEMEERRLWDLKERLGAREREKEIGAVKAEVGESSGLATEMADEEMSLDTEREVAIV